MSTIIEDKVPFAQVVAAANQDTFQYDWWIRDATDLIVFVDGLDVDPSDYSVTGTQSEDGGEVIFTLPLVGGELVTISTAYPLSRLTGYVTSGKFTAASLNMELSYLVACLQQLRRDQQRSLKLDVSSQVDPSLLILPEPVDGLVLAWNGANGALQNGPSIAEISSASESAAAALESAMDAALSAAQAAAQAAATIAIPSNSLILSSGSTTPRTLADRFSYRINAKDFGCVCDGVTDDRGGLLLAIAYASARTSLGQRNAIIVIDGILAVSSTVNVPTRVGFDCESGVILALPGFAADTAVVKFGDSASIPEPNGRWTCDMPGIIVDCNEQHVIGIDFSRPWGSNVGYAYATRCNYIGVQGTSGTGLHLASCFARFVSYLTGQTFNAGVDTIGVLVGAGLTDSIFGSNGGIGAYGSFVGVKVLGGNNIIYRAHPYGVYRRTSDGRPNSCPMGICIWNEGESNVWLAPLADSPSLVDYDQDASLSNGGYGFYNAGNGWRAMFVAAQVFVPNRSVYGETAPTARLWGGYTNQGMTVTNWIRKDSIADTGGASSFAGHFTGTTNALNQLNITGWNLAEYWSSEAPRFKRKPWFSRGIEFQATTQDTDSFPSAFGACSFSMPDAKYVRIISNYNGTTQQARIQRYRTSSSLTALNTVLSNQGSALDANDVNYQVLRTDVNRPMWWNGTKWVWADGTNAT